MYASQADEPPTSVEMLDFAGRLAVFATRPTSEDIAEMVERFLRWPLPDTVSIHGMCPPATFRGTYGVSMTGTNLLNIVEAKAMLDYVLSKD